MEYEINENTMALISNGKNESIVYEEAGDFLVNNSPNSIMESSCAYFGSSLDGRRKGTEAMIGVSYKTPIIVEESKEIIFFPTTSIKNEFNNWLSLSHIDKYYRNGDNLVVRFKNGTEISLNVSLGIIDNQILRSTRLESALRGRKIAKKHTKMG